MGMAHLYAKAVGAGHSDRIILLGIILKSICNLMPILRAFRYQKA
jgi:hypothetical protein